MYWSHIEHKKYTSNTCFNKLDTFYYTRLLLRGFIKKYEDFSLISNVQHVDLPKMTNERSYVDIVKSTKVLSSNMKFSPFLLGEKRKGSG